MKMDLTGQERRRLLALLVMDTKEAETAMTRYGDPYGMIAAEVTTNQALLKKLGWEEEEEAV
jgi:hypothetical protein